MKGFFHCRGNRKKRTAGRKSAKKAVNAARNTKIEDGCLLERRLFSALFDTEDQKTGMGAFIAGKKNVVFKNR